MLLGKVGSEAISKVEFIFVHIRVELELLCIRVQLRFILPVLHGKVINWIEQGQYWWIYGM